MIDKIISNIINQIDPISQYIYIVGGFPRDHILNNPFNDLDIILPISKDDSFFNKKNKKRIKKETGTILKKINIDNKQFNLEISPLKENNIEEDLKSRDLSINSIAYKVSIKDRKWEILDPTGGIKDLHFKILRCYEEKNLIADPIRMLRIFRFQAVFGFDIDSNTFLLIRNRKAGINDAPSEMIYEELMKLFSGNYITKALRNMALSGLLRDIIPEMQSLITFLHQDSYHHHESVFEHSLLVLDNCVCQKLSSAYKVAALFHDIAKPITFDGKHYINHEKKGALLTKIILKRLRFSNRFINTVSSIVNYHMIPMNSQKKLFELRYNLGKDAFKNQIQFIKADKCAVNFFWSQTRTYQTFSKLVKKVLQYDNEGFFEKLVTLANGTVLKKFGLKPGIAFQHILQYLRNYFFKNPEKLTRNQVRLLLEQNLYFTTHYNCFKHGDFKTKRLREYLRDHVIYGLLEDSKKHHLKSGLFTFYYFSEGEFKNWEKENQEFCTLFY
ncbi:MAG: HD domain-containing protein [bacterium]